MTTTAFITKTTTTTTAAAAAAANTTNIDEIRLTSSVVLTVNWSTMTGPEIKKMLYTLKPKSTGAGEKVVITESLEYTDAAALQSHVWLASISAKIIYRT